MRLLLVDEEKGAVPYFSWEEAQPRQNLRNEVIPLALGKSGFHSPDSSLEHTYIPLYHPIGSGMIRGRGYLLNPLFLEV